MNRDTTKETKAMTTTETVLRNSDLPTDLIERMSEAAKISGERCYQHPESPTGYVGKGRWCEHKRAVLAVARAR